MLPVDFPYIYSFALKGFLAPFSVQGNVLNCMSMEPVYTLKTQLIVIRLEKHWSTFRPIITCVWNNRLRDESYFIS